MIKTLLPFSATHHPCFTAAKRLLLAAAFNDVRFPPARGKIVNDTGADRGLNVLATRRGNWRAESNPESLEIRAVAVLKRVPLALLALLYTLSLPAIAQIVKDGGIEEKIVTPAYGMLYNEQANGGPWQFGVDGGSSGLFRPPAGGFDSRPVPEGRQAAYLQSGGTGHWGKYGAFQQKIVIPRTGQYILSYMEGGRSEWESGETHYLVMLGTQVISSNHTAHAQPYTRNTVTFAADAGEWLLKFATCPPSGGDNTALIDDVRIVAGIVFLGHPQPQQVPIGGTAVFSVAETNIAEQDIRYQWLFNGTPIPGEKSQTLTLLNVSRFFTGLYSVEVSDASTGIKAVSREARLDVSEFVVHAYPAVELEFPTELGKSYQIEASVDLVTWSNHGDPVTGTGQLISRLLRTRDGNVRYFRIKAQ